MEWTTEYIDKLPDSSFAHIEPGGQKDAEGKTTPRSLRHLPYKDADGKIDLPHLRNALARLPQANLSAEAQQKANEILTAAAKDAGMESSHQHMMGELKIPFFRLGVWKHPKYGDIVGDQAKFDSFKKNFKENLLGRPVFVRLGHDKDNSQTFGVAPAEAWVKEIQQDGDTLYAIAEPTRPQITDDVRNKRYRFASAEYAPHFIDKETGTDVGPTLTAIALTNEPFLTKLQENVVLADPPDQIYLDYKEVQIMSGKNLLQENNNLLTKLADSFNKFFESFKPSATGGLTDEERAKLSEIDSLKVKLASTEQKLSDTEQSAWVTTVESRMKDLVSKGIPPVMCDSAKAILLANPTAATTMIKLADDKEISLAKQIFSTLEALPDDQRIKMSQVGSQESTKPGSPEEIKKLADEDVKATGGKVTEDGRYIL